MTVRNQFLSSSSSSSPTASVERIAQNLDSMHLTDRYSSVLPIPSTDIEDPLSNNEQVSYSSSQCEEVKGEGPGEETKTQKKTKEQIKQERRDKDIALNDSWNLLK